MSQPSEAARKYYPPGFTPPTNTEEDDVPVSLPGKIETQTVQPAAPTIVKQIIIKNVLVPSVQKPQDPLDLLISSHRYYDAVLLVEKRLKKNPGNLHLQMTRGTLLREQGQFVSSIEQYESLLAKTILPANRAAAWSGLGWSCYEKALQDWRTGASEGEDLMLQAARNAFKQSVQQAPQLPSGWAGLARTELALKHPKEAELALKRAMHVKSNDLSVDLARADILLSQKRFDDALQLLYGVKTPAIADSDVFLFLARASMGIGKTDDAIINLKQLLELEPNHTEALKLLSQAYALKMKPENASQSLESAIALNPSDIKSVWELLKIYDSQGEQERGSVLLKTLLKTNPTQVEYIQALLNRLILKNRWRTAYEEGTVYLLPLIEKEPIPSVTADNDVYAVSKFSESIYYKARTLLDTKELMSQPAVQAVAKFTRNHEAKLSKELSRHPWQASESQVGLLLRDRRTLLYLNPLEKITPLNVAISDNHLALAIQIAFLSGNATNYQSLLARAKKLPIPEGMALDSGLPELACQLYNVGDYHGAQVVSKVILAKNPKHVPMQIMDKDITDVLRDVDEQRIALKVLSKKTSTAYWDKLAGQVLRTSTGDWRTHGLLADILTKQRRSELAFRQRQLEKQFAPN